MHVDESLQSQVADREREKITGKKQSQAVSADISQAGGGIGHIHCHMHCYRNVKLKHNYFFPVCLSLFERVLKWSVYRVLDRVGEN